MSALHVLHSCLPIASQKSRKQGSTLCSTRSNLSSANSNSLNQNVVADRQHLFNSIAPVYDNLNDLLSVGQHRIWKRMAVSWSGPKDGDAALDICCGSGDLTFLLAEKVGCSGKVIKDRKWRDITAVFNFRNTTTSASFVLRKYYISLLHRYEQVYFFGAQEQQVHQPAPLSAPSPVCFLTDNGFTCASSKHGNRITKKKRERIISSALDGDDPISFVGDSVMGKIDGRFEHGYLVTVTVGSQKLRGILYHRLPAGLERQSANALSFPRSGTYDAAAASKIQPCRRRNEMKKRDSAHPKPNRSGYNFFFADQHMRLKVFHPDNDNELSKHIDDLWNKLTEEEKAVYQERGLKDKERYRREMQEYMDMQKMQFQNPQIMTTD